MTQPDIHDEKVLILDFGSQYTQLIARRIRELKVYCEIHPCTVGMREIREFSPRGLILSGSPASVLDKGAPGVSPEIFSLGVPVLGICYGMQLITSILGARWVLPGSGSMDLPSSRSMRTRTFSGASKPGRITPSRCG